MLRKRLLTSLLGVAVLGAALSAGCNPTEPVSEAPPPAPAAAADADAVDVELASVSAEQYEQRIAESAGKVVLVDFWATWCPPCVEHFPHTLELAAKYPSDQLQVITVSADKPSSEQRVRSFLNKQNATHVMNLLTTMSVDELFERLDLRGGIPFYKLYDRQGQLRYEFNGAPAEDDRTEPIEQIEVRLKELLAEQAAAE